MAYEQRIELYKRIEEFRNRPLICYVTSSRNGAGGQMSSDVIPQFIKQINSISKECKEVDVLIVSNGGDPNVSWRIISMLREKFNKIAVLLPYAAYSASTVLSLGADEIIMHPFSNLGPVDPQLTYTKRKGEQNATETIHFGSEDIKNYVDFVHNDIGITDQLQKANAFELLAKDIGTIPIGVAKRSSQLALSMGEKLLNLHMEDKSKAKAIAEALNSSFYHHGYPLGPSEAEKIGLPIKRPEQILEQLLWDVWEDYEDEMECNNSFDPLQIVLKSQEQNKLLQPVQQANIPNNLPPNIVQQAYNSILQTISIQQINPVDCETIHACVESTNCRSTFKSKWKILATRHPNMNIAVSTLKIESEWTFLKS